MKECLITAPVLAYPNFDREFIVQNNAILSVVGGVLSYINEKEEEHPVNYCSRTLNVYKSNYTIIERECLAVIYFYKQFRVYLHSKYFKVLLYHSSLRWL